MLCVFRIFLLLFCFAGSNLNAQQQNTSEHLHIESTPDWVTERPYQTAEFIPEDEVSNGIFYQLLDNQIKVENDGFRTAYSRYIETAINQTGVEDISQLNIDFDPSYQKLVLNSLTVIRDGKRIDKLKDAKISIFSRETDLEKQIYSGRLTLNVLLDDIQVGDTLDFSYTRQGHNPVYQNSFSYLRSINWSVPVYNQNVRVLWGKPSLLKIETRNINPDVKTSQMGNYTEYQVNLQNEDTVNAPSESPYWYNPYGTIYFNEAQNWSDVVDWAEPMYRFGEITADIQSIADSIQATTSSPSEQIVLALKYAQEDIRYVGLEMGQNSHMPTAPGETLALKYGDCKDKAALLIAILEAMQLEAFPALVDTDNTKLLAELPAGVNLFNHVIVGLELEGKQIWLDPTLNNQDGNLSNLYQPDYGFALVLKEGQSQLTAMYSEDREELTYITEKYVIPENDEDPISFAVSTSYKGYEAINKQWQLEQNGKKKIAEDYEEYYQRTYPSLKADLDMTVESDKISGVITFEESYIIDEFWKMGDEHWKANFYPTNIRNAVFKPKQIQRNGPLFFKFPDNIRNQVEITFKDAGWDFDPEEFVEDNAFFSYSSIVSFEENKLTLTYNYHSKTDHIPHEKIDEYLAARDRLRKDAYYGIIKYVKDEPATEAEEELTAETENTTMLVLKALGFIYLLGFLYIILDWRIEAKKRPVFAESHYYPIAAWKFISLSIITFGIYDAYWMYRNWKAIKGETEDAIGPILRGIFVIFWVFPLFSVLRQEADSKPGKVKVPSLWVAVIVATAYLFFRFTSNYSEAFPYSLLFLVAPLLLLPIVNYIAKLNAASPEAGKFNTQWRVRHSITTVLFAPLLLFAVLLETPFLPSDSVVNGSSILQRDMKFMYRQKLLPPSETIHYFYSDAFFDVREDGNGFTDNRVFSYWQDDDEGLQKEIATFQEIENIQVEFSDSDLANTIITITRNDKSDFMLFVSNVDEGDKRFVETLKQKWRSHEN